MSNCLENFAVGEGVKGQPPYPLPLTPMGANLTLQRQLVIFRFFLLL